MPLPRPERRQHYHKRSISCDGYLRDDGLWDIEAHMTDIKSSSVDDSERVFVPAGEAFHDIWLRVSIDTSFAVREVHASIEASPFMACPNITDAYNKLIGTRIGPGWRTKAKELVGGVDGCTHLSELLPVIATTAFQCLWPLRDTEELENGYKMMLDTCHSWSSDGELANTIFPDLALKTTD